MTTPTDTTQPLDLDAIRAREAAATRGPWVHTGRNHIETPTIDVDEANWGGEGLHGYRLVCDGDEGAWRVADAEFIAAARTDVPALLVEVERLRGEVARMSAVVDTARTWRHGVLTSGEECSTYALACAVDALDERSGR